MANSITPRVGEHIPAIWRCPKEVDLFLYSAATWNPHRIHWDRHQARLEGHADLVVHGPLQGNWLIELIENWLGPSNHRIRRLRFRHLRSAYVNRRYRIEGVVEEVRKQGTARNSSEVECCLWVAGEDGVTTRGWALLELEGVPVHGEL